jgi:hypothetical protein
MLLMLLFIPVFSGVATSGHSRRVKERTRLLLASQCEMRQPDQIVCSSSCASAGGFAKIGMSSSV